MAVSPKKTTKSRKRSRRSHHAIKGVLIHYCPNCNVAFKPHSVCEACGFHKGKQVKG